MRCPQCNSLTNYERKQLTDKKFPQFFACECGCLWTEWQKMRVYMAEAVIIKLKEELGYYSEDHPAFRGYKEYLEKYPNSNLEDKASYVRPYGT
jgi:hypothetical protein